MKDVFVFNGDKCGVYIRASGSVLDTSDKIIVICKPDHFQKLVDEAAAEITKASRRGCDYVWIGEVTIKRILTEHFGLSLESPNDAEDEAAWEGMLHDLPGYVTHGMLPLMKRFFMDGRKRLRAELAAKGGGS